MGSFYSTCSASGMTLTGQKTSILLLVPGYSSNFKEHLGMIVSDGCQTFFSPFGFPIHGEYDDYGYITNIVRTKSVDILEEYFGIGIDYILQNIGDDDLKDIKNKEVYGTLGRTYFRTEILEYLERGWDTISLSNPSKYSREERLKTLFEFIESKSKRKSINIDDLINKSKKNPLTDDEKIIVMDSIKSSISDYDIRSSSYITTLANKNMFLELDITLDMKDEILKQQSMLGALTYLRKNLIPSTYGSQQDNWSELYNFNDFVNDILADNIESWGEPNSMEVDIINHHKIIKRDRKLNSLIND